MMEEQKMNRRELLKKTGIAVGSMLAADAYAVSKTVLANASVTIKAGQQNNILFIFADQMHGFVMGCMGHPDVKTPNLDWLASEGTLFRNAYSQAPVCTPYRCCLFTGRYASQTGVVVNELPIPAGERTFAAAFNDGGYRTSYVGKWHLGGTGNIAVPQDKRGGFTDFIGYECYNDYIDDVMFFDEDGNYTPTTDHRTKETTDIAIERLATIADKKFAMFVSYQNPHYPEQPTLKYEKMYESLTPTRRPNCTTNPTFDPYIAVSAGTHTNTDGREDYKNDLDQYLRQYYAMITQLDANLGRLFAEVKRLGLWDKTTIIFTSDHGDMQGSHGLKNKSVHWEESTRVPFIVRAPGGVKGQVLDYLVSAGIDPFPTCLAFAGLPQEPTTEGNNLAPLVMGQRPLDPVPVFSELGGWAMIREGDYKMTVSKSDWQPDYFFNLDADPYELNNLVNNSSYDSIKSDLLAKIVAWRDHVQPS
jgi:arylsulfatase A-like enzyme